MNKLPSLKNATVADYIDKALRDGKGIDEILMRFKNSVVVRALTLQDGNVTQAAILLKTARNNLIRWMQEYRIAEQAPNQDELP
jgi:DNA-binding NtrC family response regulator